MHDNIEMIMSVCRGAYLAVVIDLGHQLYCAARNGNAVSSWQRSLYRSAIVLMSFLAVQLVYGFVLSLFTEVSVEGRDLFTLVEVLAFPASAVVLLTLARHELFSLAQKALLYSGFVVFLVVYVLTWNAAVFEAVRYFCALYSIAVVWYSVRFTMKYHDSLKRVYSDLKGRDLHWFVNVIVAFSILVVLWLVTRTFFRIGDVVYYLGAMFLWRYVVCCILGQRDVDLSGCHEVEQESGHKLDGELFGQGMERVCKSAGVYANPDVSVADVAKEMGTEAGLIVAYLGANGSNFYDYILNIRMEQATKLLAGSALECEDVACQCGYSNYESFERAFEKRYWCTPGEYRKHLM